MGQIFLTSIKIKKIRHLENILIPLDTGKRKHMIFTGKNGSGKTSVLEGIAEKFEYILSDSYAPNEKNVQSYEYWNEQLNKLNPQENSEKNLKEKEEVKRSIKRYGERLDKWESGVSVECNSFMITREKFQKGEFILAYYKADRILQVEEYQNIEKVELKQNYKITETPGSKLTKYLVDLKATEAFSKDKEKSGKIEKWFERFESILKKIFHDNELRLIFHEDTFQFSIEGVNFSVSLEE